MFRPQMATWVTPSPAVRPQCLTVSHLQPQPCFEKSPPRPRQPELGSSCLALAWGPSGAHAALSCLQSTGLTASWSFLCLRDLTWSEQGWGVGEAGATSPNLS